MPADYLIDRAIGVVFSRAWGVLTDADLLEHQRRLGLDPEFNPSWNQLFDFHEVTDVQVTAAGIRTLAERNLFRTGSHRAFTVRFRSDGYVWGHADVPDSDIGVPR